MKPAALAVAFATALAGAASGTVTTPDGATIRYRLTASLADYRPVLSKIDTPAMIVVARSPSMECYEDAPACRPCGTG